MILSAPNSDSGRSSTRARCVLFPPDVEAVLSASGTGWRCPPPRTGFLTPTRKFKFESLPDFGLKMISPGLYAKDRRFFFPVSPVGDDLKHCCFKREGWLCIPHLKISSLG